MHSFTPVSVVKKTLLLLELWSCNTALGSSMSIGSLANHIHAVLYCSLLCCIVLSCVGLYYVVCYCIVLFYIMLCCVVLCCMLLCRIVSYCVVCYCIVLYCIVLYCVLLHRVSSYSPPLVTETTLLCRFCYMFYIHARSCRTKDLSTTSVLDYNLF